MKTESPKCKVCGNEDVLYLCKVYNGHSETKEIHNYKCKSCGLVFVGNDLTDEELGVAYSSLDSTEYYREIADENRRKMDYAVKKILHFADKSSKIIDIGTGEGAFLEVLDGEGFTNIAGHEIPGANMSGVEDFAEIYQDFDLQTIPSETFDVVTMLDVLEHVKDPHNLLESCYRILKPGGYVYYHTPVVTQTDRLMHNLMNFSAFEKITGMWQSSRTSIFHLQNYTSESTQILLNNSSFELVEFIVKNELSWSVSRYVRIYLLDKIGLPKQLSPIFVPLIYPFVATNALNANKSIVTARKPA